MNPTERYVSRFGIGTNILSISFLILFGVSTSQKTPATSCNSEKNFTIFVPSTLLSMDTVNVPTLDTVRIRKRVKATFYNPDPRQTNSVYWRTASGATIDTLDPYRHRWIAVSRDLEKEGFSMGDTVRVSGIDEMKGRMYNGTWIIQDRMNSKWVSKIDFLVGSDMYMSSFTNLTIESV